VAIATARVSGVSAMNPQKLKKSSGVSCLSRILTNNCIVRMTFDRTKDAHYEELNASIALAVAFFEQTGLRELIDSKFNTDVRQKLSPGNAVKALIGDMVGTKGRSALFNVADRYRSVPVDLMFGPKADIPSMGWGDYGLIRLGLNRLSLGGNISSRICYKT